MDIKSELFGKTKDGKVVTLFTLTNDNGMTISITDFGGIVTSILTPDKNGKVSDVVLGFDNFDDYLGDHPYFGALIGRYGNRIANGEFTLDGIKYKLAQNNGKNHLHGGILGFDKIIWDALPVRNDDEVSLKLSHLSKDMDEGYPGNLFIKVSYILTNQNEFKISYCAETDKATPVNLTNHCYFNLTGCKENIRNHELYLKASQYTVVNDDLIPTGVMADVTGTPLDFRTAHKIGERIDEVLPPIGYDNNFVIDKKNSDLDMIATVYEPKSGRFMEVFTTEPGVQLYCAGGITSINGKKKQAYKKHFGFCLETQHFPDSPNKPEFPTTILKPDQIYSQLTIYKFSVK